MLNKYQILYFYYILYILYIIYSYITLFLCSSYDTRVPQERFLSLFPNKIQMMLNQPRPAPPPPRQKKLVFYLSSQCSRGTAFKALLTGGHGKGCVRAVWAERYVGPYFLVSIRMQSLWVDQSQYTTPTKRKCGYQRVMYM